jgi:adenylate cyclase
LGLPDPPILFEQQLLAMLKSIAHWPLQWLDKIEQRVTLPGDSETRRSQKTMLVVVALFGFVATLFNAVPMFNGGLNRMGWTYVGSAVFILLGALLILAWPRGFTLFAFLLLLDVLIFPAITQVLSGGYASGMFFMAWPILAPIGAVLVLGARHTLVQFVLFMLTVFVVAAMEPFSQSIAPPITSEVRLGYNVPALISLGLIIAAASLYLLRQIERFRKRVDSLLLDILPDSIAARLKIGPKTIADGFDSVTVLFADIVDFTTLTADANPRDVVRLLNAIFSEDQDRGRRLYGSRRAAAAAIRSHRSGHRLCRGHVGNYPAAPGFARRTYSTAHRP